ESGRGRGEAQTCQRLSIERMNAVHASNMSWKLGGSNTLARCRRAGGEVELAAGLSKLGPALAWMVASQIRCHQTLHQSRHHWRPMLIGLAIISGELTAAYVLTSYMPTYLETEVGLSSIQAAMATVP